MKTTLDILSYPMPVMNFSVMDRILPSTFLAIDILEVFLSKALAMWARAADRMHALLFLLMHFTAGGSPCGEEYRSYLIRNTEHSDRTFYWSAGTIMTF
jgi:hypothetical protein